MLRYYFTARFTDPLRGPEFAPLAPFDKVEVVQAESSPYPAPDTCMVSVECQAHTALVEVEEGQTPDSEAVAALEALMDAAVLAMSGSHAYLGKEDT